MHIVERMMFICKLDLFETIRGNTTKEQLQKQLDQVFEAIIQELFEHIQNQLKHLSDLI